MRVTSLLILLACACSGAQVVMSGSGSKTGVYFRYETRIEPELSGQKITGFGGGLFVDGGFHRFLSDTTTRKYFGYDLSIDPQPGEMFRVTFEPLSLSAEKLRLEPAGGWSQISLPLLPAPQMVRSRDTIAVDLFVHPGTGQKIVDYLFIQDDRRAFRLPSGPPRDYTVDDVPIALNKLRLTVNGKQVDESGGGISGAAVYFYLPNYGRFVFSLAPHEQLGFRKAGEVRGSTLTITWGNDTFVLDCDGPIAPGGGVFHLYVFHEPSWRPRGPDSFQLGASSARSLVRRKP